MSTGSIKNFYGARSDEVRKPGELRTIAMRRSHTKSDCEKPDDEAPACRAGHMSRKERSLFRPIKPASGRSGDDSNARSGQNNRADRPPSPGLRGLFRGHWVRRGIGLDKRSRRGSSGVSQRGDDVAALRAGATRRVRYGDSGARRKRLDGRRGEPGRPM